MAEIKRLKEALKQNKVRLTQEQLQELDRREWFEQAQNMAAQIAQGQVTADDLKEAEQRLADAILEAFGAGFDAAIEEIVSRVAGDVKGLVDAITGIKIPETSLKPVLDRLEDLRVDVPAIDLTELKKEIRKLNKRPKDNWVFEVHRDRDGRITEIYADKDER